VLLAAIGGCALPDVGSMAYTWGSTRAEQEAPFPCDRHLADADEAFFRAVDVEAPPAIIFRWLCQLRVAPYSYDWIDNFGRESPRQLTPGLEVLALGQRVMGGFVLVEFETDRHLTAVTQTPPLEALFGQFAASYVVVPRGEARSRLVVKVLARYAPGIFGRVARWLLPWGDFVMMRKQLLTLKHLAETTD